MTFELIRYTHNFSRLNLGIPRNRLMPDRNRENDTICHHRIHRTGEFAFPLAFLFRIRNPSNSQGQQEYTREICDQLQKLECSEFAARKRVSYSSKQAPSSTSFSFVIPDISSSTQNGPSLFTEARGPKWTANPPLSKPLTAEYSSFLPSRVPRAAKGQGRARWPPLPPPPKRPRRGSACRSRPSWT